MGVHQFPPAIKISGIAGWISNSVKFEVWLPRHTNRREGEKPYRASQLPPAMQRHWGHYGGILHNEPREIQISRISVWAVMLSGEIPMAWLSCSGLWSSIWSTHATTPSLAAVHRKIVALPIIARQEIWFLLSWAKLSYKSYKSSFGLKVGNSHSLDSVLGMENGG